MRNIIPAAFLAALLSISPVWASDEDNDNREPLGTNESVTNVSPIIVEEGAASSTGAAFIPLLLLALVAAAAAS